MVAIIDIGANTVRLSVYETAGETLRQLSKVKHAVELATHTDKNGALTRAGIDETIKVLRGFKKDIANIKPEKTYVIAASALRNITNTAEVVFEIKRETGFDVTVISGETEAICAFTAVKPAIKIHGDGLVVDIGGGSTELVLTQNCEAAQAISLPIGSLDMYNRHVAEILPSSAEAEKIRRDTQLALREFNVPAQKNLYGTGGTLRALLKLHGELFNVNPQTHTISIQEIRDFLNALKTDAQKTIAEKFLRITPERMHTITPGLIILDTIAEKYNCEKIIVNETGVREGFLLQRDVASI